MLHFLANGDRLDDLALLCALFRELHGQFDIAMMSDVYDLLVMVPNVLASRMRLPELVANLLHQLIADRVLGDFWHSAEEMSRASGISAGEGSRKGNFQRLLTWYAYGGAMKLRRSNAQYPIVSQQARLAWLDAHWEKLVRIHQMVPEQAISAESMPESLEEWELLKQSHSDQLTRQLELGLPDRGGTGCLPISRPLGNTFDWLLEPVYEGGPSMGIDLQLAPEGTVVR